MSESRNDGIGKTLFLVPNALTTFSLFFGFYSILSAFKGDLMASFATIAFAVITDGLDGRLARLTNTQSAFGKEYDSLADMVAFAVAPALIVYCFVFQPLGKVGWSLSFIYMAATGFRLARFNSKTTDLSEFIGLACPTAALWVVSMLCVLQRFHLASMTKAYLMGGVTLTAAVLMVSTFRYPSFKKMDHDAHQRNFVVLTVMLLLALVLLHPPIVISLLGTVYALYAPITQGYAWLRDSKYLKQKLVLLRGGKDD